MSVSLERRSTSRSFHSTIERPPREAHDAVLGVQRVEPLDVVGAERGARRVEGDAAAGQDGEAVGDAELAAEAVGGHEDRAAGGLERLRGAPPATCSARWSRPANGSSSSSTRGRGQRRAAPATAGAACPTENVRTRSSGVPLEVDGGQGAARARRRSAGCPPSVAQKRRFSQRGQVLVHLGAVGDAGRRARGPRSASRAQSRPATRAAPRVGRSSVATIRSSVVLPAPLAPSSATASPAPTLKDTPSRPVTSRVDEPAHGVLRGHRAERPCQPDGRKA